MEKDLILIGKAYSGKTKKAREIAKTFSPDEVVWIKGRELSEKKLSPFLFHFCDENTKLIIVDDILPSCNMEFFYSVVGVPFQANIHYSKPKTITAKFLLTCDENITRETLDSLGDSFTRRFEIIEMIN